MNNIVKITLYKSQEVDETGGNGGSSSPIDTEVLKQYVKKEELNEIKSKLSLIDNLDNLATNEDLVNEIKKLISKEALESAISGVGDSVRDLTNKLNEVKDSIPTELLKYVSKDELTKKLESYVTKSELDTLKDSLPDTSLFVTKDRHQKDVAELKKLLLGKIQDINVKDELLDLKTYLNNNYYTKAGVDARITERVTTIASGGVLTLEGYATIDKLNEVVNNAVSSLASKTVIETLATKEALKEVKDVVDTLNSVDLSNYYSKSDSDGRYALKTDVANVPTDVVREQQLTDAINSAKIELRQAIDNVTPTVDLSNYYNKTETYSKTEAYSKQEVDDLLAALPSGGSGTGSGLTPAQSAILSKLNNIFTTYEGYTDGTSDTITDTLSKYVLKSAIPEPSELVTTTKLTNELAKVSKATITESRLTEEVNKIKANMQDMVTDAISGPLDTKITDIAKPLVEKAINKGIESKIEPAVNNIIAGTILQTKDEIATQTDDKIRDALANLNKNNEELNNYTLLTKHNADIDAVKKLIPVKGSYVTPEQLVDYASKDGIKDAVKEQLSTVVTENKLINKDALDKELKKYMTAADAAKAISREILDSAVSKESLAEAMGDVIANQDIPIELQVTNMESLGFVHMDRFTEFVADMNKQLVNEKQVLQDAAVAKVKEMLVTDKVLTVEKLKDYATTSNIPSLVKAEIDKLRDTPNSVTHYTKQEIDDQIHILKNTLKNDLLKEHVFEISLPDVVLDGYVSKHDLSKYLSKLTTVENAITSLGLDRINLSGSTSLVTTDDIDTKVTQAITPVINNLETTINNNIDIILANKRSSYITDISNYITNNVKGEIAAGKADMESSITTLATNLVKTKSDEYKQEMKDYYNTTFNSQIESARTNILDNIKTEGLTKAKVTPFLHSRKPSYYADLGPGVYFEYGDTHASGNFNSPMGSNSTPISVETKVQIYLRGDTFDKNFYSVIQRIEYIDANNLTGAVKKKVRYGYKYNDNNDNWSAWKDE